MTETAYPGKEKANRMRDLREELDRLREKLRRVELRTSRQMDAPAEKPIAGEGPEEAQRCAETPPWDCPSDELSFERSLPESAPRAFAAEVGLPLRRSRGAIEDCITGRVVQTPFGAHFEVDTHYDLDASHGRFALSDLPLLPGNLLNPLCPQHPATPAEEWVFLDTETNGLAGGAGTFAFLIGLGYITSDGFLVRQFFLREPAEERSVLHRLTEELGRFSTIVSYNGKGYDLPLLETRYRLARTPVPFSEMPHLDLLHACRRLWKLRFDSCKLTHLEERILGHERVGDVPGFLIPSLYVNYLRFQEAGSLVPVFTHNALDILSLACLTAVVGGVFADPSNIVLRHGAECIGLGRWLMQAGRPEDALPLFRQAINTNIPEELLARTLWDISGLERKSQRYAASRDALEQILGFPNQHHRRALEALSILYERRLNNIPRSLYYARRLEQLQPDEKVGARLERLVKKLDKSRRGQFLEDQ
ncbi:MAG: ribonuclease H-like domain-containing protein [Bryobacterales bacterium]|nr:ribonuclease H-like domain-containing protein [Bryobacterales bacterium]